MFELEKYRGRWTRHTCPGCGARSEFTRYVDETGDYIDPAVGRCNRQIKCGYHQTPKDYFEANPDIADAYKSAMNKPRRRAKNPIVEPPPAPTVESAPFIDPSLFLRTLTNYENNAFAQFLFDLFPNDAAAVEKAVKDYFLGSTRDGKTIFWQIDRRQNIRTGKIIDYDRQTGKRKKYTNWIHAILKDRRQYPQDAQPVKCLFGEHLLAIEDERTAAIVEAEKTAVIASICFPQFVWLAAGGLDQLKAWKMQSIADRQIILYPDAKGFARWSEVAQDGAAYGLTINVSSLLENGATDAEKENDADLADYLIEEQCRKNAIPERVEFVQEEMPPATIKPVELFEYVEMEI